MLSNYIIIRDKTVPKVRINFPNVYVCPANIAIGRPGPGHSVIVYAEILFSRSKKGGNVNPGHIHVTLPSSFFNVGP